MRPFLHLLALAAALLPAAVARAAPAGVPVASPTLVAAVQACAPAAPCAARLPVRVVIVTMFEIGADTGDEAGEFQLWRERRHLDTRIAFPQSYHDLYYDPRTGVLAMVTGVGSARSSSAAMALGLDPRFDLGQAYWLIAGIAGIDPADASIGSAAWARYSVDGDLAHEIDAREIPAGWKNGFFPLDAKGPEDGTRRSDPSGVMFALNPGLRDWAYELTRGVTIPDDPGIAKERARYTGFPIAQRPPFVLKGDQLSAMTFWHGRFLTDWANGWVDEWTGGKGRFVTSAMEETGTLQALTYLNKAGRADWRRVMLLRTGSNYTMPPPGISAADYLKQENAGYSGMRVSVESLYVVGSKVIDTLLADWDRYARRVPG